MKNTSTYVNTKPMARPEGLSELALIRRDNMRLLKVRHGGRKLAGLMGQSQSSFISQMSGPNPTREVTEKTARLIEIGLNLPSGALDHPIHDVDAPTPAAITAQHVGLMSDAILAIGSVCAAENVSLSTLKLTSLISIVLTDAVAHKGEVRKEFISQIVVLLK